MIEVCGLTTHATQEGGDASNKYLRRSSAGKCAQCRIGRLWNKSLQALVVVNHFIVVAHPHGIGEGGLEEVSLLQGNNPPRAGATEQNVIDAIWGREMSLVVQVGTGCAVLLGKFVIQPDREEVLGDDLLSGETVLRKIGVRQHGSIRQVVKCQKLLSIGVDRHGDWISI